MGAQTSTTAPADGSKVDSAGNKSTGIDSLKSGGTLGWIVPLMIAVGLALLIALIVVLVQSFTSSSPAPVTGISGISGTTGLTGGPLFLPLIAQQGRVVLTTGAAPTLLNADQGLYLEDSNQADGTVDLVDKNVVLQNNIQCDRLTLSHSRLSLNGFALQSKQIVLTDGSQLTCLPLEDQLSSAAATITVEPMPMPMERRALQRQLVTETKFEFTNMAARARAQSKSRDWISAQRFEFSQDSKIVMGEKDLILRCDEWALVSNSADGVAAATGAAAAGIIIEKSNGSNAQLVLVQVKLPREFD